MPPGWDNAGVTHRLARAGALAALLAGSLVGASGAPAPAATTASAPTACGVAPGGAWRILSTSTPCRIEVAVGARVPFRLSTSFRWSAPRSSSRAVTVTSNAPATRGLIGTIHALRVGQARLTATGVMVCAPGRACPDLAMLWQLDVTVVAHLASPLSVTVTLGDAGASYALHVGDQLVVDLASGSIYRWSVPQAGDATVLERVAAGAGTATFDAVGAGSTTVTAVGNPTCYPGCLAPSRLFDVKVTVTS